MVLVKATGLELGGRGQGQAQRPSSLGRTPACLAERRVQRVGEKRVSGGAHSLTARPEAGWEVGAGRPGLRPGAEQTRVWGRTAGLAALPCLKSAEQHLSLLAPHFLGGAD